MNLCPFIPKYQSLLGTDEFDLLNQKTRFENWNMQPFDMLWTYNLNYMDYLLQKEISVEDGMRWIDKFINEANHNVVGFDPYPISLRGINWIKFITTHYEDVLPEKKKRWDCSLAAQYRILEDNLEYHLLGNHLLENACSLFIGSIYFADERLFIKASQLLTRELIEQILPDGAHYEQSPMYHCILLDRLLDCYNFSTNNIFYPQQQSVNEQINAVLKKMLGHLESIIWADGTIPLLNDSAYNVAPIPEAIFEYAKRLNIDWLPIPLRECGYKKLGSERMEVIVDVGGVKASYQPGHSHADTFNFELRIDGTPIIVDTGISTYNKTERRQYERSTKAHNTVVIGEKNSSEVWGGFRIGKRAEVVIEQDETNIVKAHHNGFGKLGTHRRQFMINSDGFEILDFVDSNANAISYIHFAPGIKVLSYSDTAIETDRAIIAINGAKDVYIEGNTISTEYNLFQSNTSIAIIFTSRLSCLVSAK